MQQGPCIVEPSTSLASGGNWSSLLSESSSIMDQLATITISRQVSATPSLLEPEDGHMVANPEGGHLAGEPEQGSAPQSAEQINLKCEILIMLVCGALFDFLSKTIYQLLPGTDSGVRGLDVNKWATWALTVGCQVATAIPPTLQEKNRDALKNLNINLCIKLVVPSIMAMLVTVTRLAAIVYMSPSVVAIIKISVNLAVLALIGQCRGKKLLGKQWIALLGCFVGLIIVSLEDFIFPDKDNEEKGGASKQLVGLSLSILCGVLGGFRNVVEEVLLQGDDLPSGALLMCEFWLSCIFMIPIYFVLNIFNNPGEPGAMGLIKEPEIAVLLVFFAITSWGKDAGKLKITKVGSAILVKVIALMFPFGTWILSLAAYLLDWRSRIGDRVGEDFSIQSLLRLTGFLTILCFAYMFSTAKKPKPEAS